MLSLRYRIREWFAAHFRTVQYPRIAVIPRAQPIAPVRLQMPVHKIVILLIASLGMLFLGLGVLAAMAFMVWLILSP
jgi:hypothetical protein